MSEGVDRAAKALIDIDPNISGYHETHLAIKRPDVRAVLKSIREPTNEMIRAGLKVKPTVIETWQAVIDELLK